MVEGEGIYKDLKDMRRLLKREAYFLMEKSNRICFYTPTLEVCERALVAFEMAYDFPDERRHYAKEMKARCAVLKLCIEDFGEENLLSGVSKKTGRRAESVLIELCRLMGSIDKGIGRYVNSVLKGKTTTL